MVPADIPPPYAAIAFDCDSTLSTIEGIEELARSGTDAGTRQRLEALTAQAMDGEVPLEEVYGRRLELVRPSRADLEDVGRRYVETVLPGAKALVRDLLRLDKRVLIVSGGLRPAVVVLGRHLGLAENDVHAVDVTFDAAGEYAGFDRSSPLARAGGKLELLSALGPSSLALVGDGATDLEAAPAVARFVAFGGVVRRPAVFAAAAVTSEARDLGDLAGLLLTADERATLEAAPHPSSSPQPPSRR